LRPFGLGSSLGQAFLAGWRCSRCQGQRDRRGPCPGQCPLPCECHPAVWADLTQALREDRLDVMAGPGDGGAELLRHVQRGRILHAKWVRALSARLRLGMPGFWLGAVVALEDPGGWDDVGPGRLEHGVALAAGHGRPG
jgi:hypothetical protein